MAWQQGTIATTSSYRDLLTSMVAMATSQHISAVTINAAGTGYTAGDILTISHASGYHSATIEVLTVSAGAVATVKLRNMGAFATRLASATVNAGGSGYAVNDILQVQGGTSTEKAKVKVATLSGSAVATVTVIETGGAYTSAPGLTGATTTGIGPAAFAGNNACTLNLTMQAIIGTTGIAATGGTGSGATFNLTLTATGWSVVGDSHAYTVNSVSTEKQVVLFGTVSGGDAPYIAYRTYTQTSGINTRYGIECYGMTGFNSGTSFATQAGLGPETALVSNRGAYILVREGAASPQKFWISCKGKRIRGASESTVTSVCRQSFYSGFGNPYGTETENPYPLIVAGSCHVPNTAADDTTLAVTGLSECARISGNAGPVYYRYIGTGSYLNVVNNNGNAALGNVNMFPTGASNEINTATDPGYVVVDDGPIQIFSSISLNTRASATRQMRPPPSSGGNGFVGVPLVIMDNQGNTTASTDDIVMELDGVVWIPGTKDDGTAVVTDDYFDDANGDRWRMFQCGAQTQRYHYFAMKED